MRKGGQDVHPHLIVNSSCDIVIRNDPKAHILSVDIDTILAPEFLEYSDIILAHHLAVNSDFGELFVGQQLKKQGGLCICHQGVQHEGVNGL